MKKFVSLDIEGTGTIPGLHSILSVGLVEVSLNEEGKWACKESIRFSANLLRRYPLGWNREGEPLSPEMQLQMDGPDMDPSTREWWLNQQEAWNITRRDLRPHANVAAEITAWAEQHGLQQATLIAWPTAYDIPHFRSLFVDGYEKNPPFGYSGYCLSTAKRLLRTLNRRSDFDVPSSDLIHHEAISDAIFQGRFAAMLFNSLGTDYP